MIPAPVDVESPWTRLTSSATAMVAFAVGPFAIGMAILFVHLAGEYRQNAMQEITARVQAISATFDGELQSAIQLAEVLAAAEDIRNGDIPAAEPTLRRVVATQDNVKTIAITDIPTERFLFNSVLPPGTTAPAGPTALSQSRLVAETGRTTVFGLRASGPTTPDPIIPVRAPILRDGVVTRTLTLSIDPRYLNGIFNRSGFGDDWTGALIDPDLIIAARNRAPEQFVGRRITPQLEQAVAAETEGVFGSVNQEGRRTYSFFVRSPHTGWLTVGGLSAEQLDKKIRRDLLPLILGGLVAIGLGIASVAAVAGRIRHNRARARDALARTRAILNTVIDGIVTTDRDGVIESCNPAAARIFQYSIDELVGRNVRMLTPEPTHGEPDDDRSRDRPWSMADLGTPREFVGRRKSGDAFPMDLAVSQFVHGGRTLYVAVCRDITGRKRHENEILAANKELDSFAHSVSHDLRAPLRAIDGFSQALEEEYGDKIAGAGRDYLKRVRVAAGRMGQLIDDLLNLSRVTRTKLQVEEIDLSKMAGEIVDELKSRAPLRRVSIRIAPDMRCRADGRMIRIVLENLLANAWKYTGKTDDTQIEVGAEKSDTAERVFFVRDNGSGFDMAYADKLFTPFQRLHSAREFEGTGIGLATVARAIQRCGGRVWAEAEVGKGAAFFFTVAGWAEPPR